MRAPASRSAARYGLREFLRAKKASHGSFSLGANPRQASSRFSFLRRAIATIVGSRRATGLGRVYDAAFSRLEAALIAARVRGGGVYST